MEWPARPARAAAWPNIGIVSAYNDMLSAHQPLERFPALIKMAAREAGAIAQFTHNVFDAALCLGVCDKIVPGLLIGALAFGHLPVILAPRRSRRSVATIGRWPRSSTKGPPSTVSSACSRPAARPTTRST
jgi:dihydroxyacid dehydratase/phosphogluconate dehydratase